MISLRQWTFSPQLRTFPWFFTRRWPVGLWSWPILRQDYFFTPIKSHNFSHTAFQRYLSFRIWCSSAFKVVASTLRRHSRFNVGPACLGRFCSYLLPKCVNFCPWDNCSTLDTYWFLGRWCCIGLHNVDAIRFPEWGLLQCGRWWFWVGIHVLKGVIFPVCRFLICLRRIWKAMKFPFRLWRHLAFWVRHFAQPERHSSTPLPFREFGTIFWGLD